MTPLEPLQQEWIRQPEPALHGGYVAWEAAHLDAPPAGKVWFLPLFLQLTSGSGGPASLAAAIDAVLSDARFLIARDERDILLAEKAMLSPVSRHDIRVVGYCEAGSLGQIPAFCNILHVGAPVLMDATGLGAVFNSDDRALELPKARLAATSCQPPVIGIIDDGIAFLNARFRSAPKKTRFAAVWLQAPEVQEPAGVICGQSLPGPDIDSLLNEGATEADIYRRLNRQMLPRAERQSTNHRVSHGTHVLDLAAGAAMDEPADADLRQMPILAVQLPPAALRDTSGRRLEGYVVQGLRWILAQNLRRQQDGAVAPLIINLSLGSLAGPGDSSAFLADWLAYETARYARLAPGSVLRIVAAYGNARRARLVARAELRDARDLSLDWRILPDDHTPSFVELRATKQRSGALQLQLLPPDPGLAPLDIPWPLPGECWTIGDPAIAMVTGVKEDGHLMVHVSVAPTAGAATVAPAGRWQIKIASNDAAPAQLSIRVQRDDTPAGYRILGRQSWLDHPQGWTWDQETRDWTAPKVGPDAPVTREGSAVSYAGTTAAGVYLVGAVRPETGVAGAWRPAVYSASGVLTAGSPGESAGPGLAALGDDGAIQVGRRASGVLTGSTARLSGTSVAAPSVARALAMFHAGKTGNITPDQELAVLLGRAPAPDRSPLIGFGILAEGAAPLLIA